MIKRRVFDCSAADSGIRYILDAKEMKCLFLVLRYALAANSAARLLDLAVSTTWIGLLACCGGKPKLDEWQRN